MTTRHYAPEYPRQIVELVRAGRTVETLSGVRVLSGDDPPLGTAGGP